jgi:acyl dehydratase
MNERSLPFVYEKRLKVVPTFPTVAAWVARFASPVYPGETITVDLWRDAEVVSFEAKIRARGVTVMKNGKSTLRSADGIARGTGGGSFA